METHMWKSTMPWRGKKMSLDLGNYMHMPMGIRDTDLLKCRPDLLYPYISSNAYLNGIQQNSNTFHTNRLFPNES